MNIESILLPATLAQASDLHLTRNRPPIMRINGKLKALDTFPSLTEQDLILLYETLVPPQKSALFLQNYDLDFTYSLPHLGRFRVNIFKARSGCSFSIRMIPSRIPALENYNNFLLMQKLLEHKNGLILITGKTGCGKSTTLAAMLDYINRHHTTHIITLEDPIEFLFQEQNAIIHQREVGTEVNSFNMGLRAALREDPDLIMLGELRDLDSIRLAMQAAETGHLVLATLHASSACRAIDRIIDIFPSDEKQLVRIALSETLAAILQQELVLQEDNKERVLVQEILIATPAIRNLIREHKITQIESIMETSVHLGMKTLARAKHELAQ